MKKTVHFILIAALLGGLSWPAWAEEKGDGYPEADREPTDTPPENRLLHKLFLFKQNEQELVRKPLYPVRVETGNNSLKTLITKHLSLITQQKQEDLDAEQIGFLAEEAPGQVQTILQTEGYFNATVNVKHSGNEYVVQITPGPRTHVKNVSVSITGDIAEDDNLSLYYKNALENWALPVNDPFTQGHWSDSKTSVLSAVVRKKYPLAAIQASRATIDPQKNQADLMLTIDSRQPIYFGPIEVSGAQRYAESVVLGMAHFAPGEPYDLDQLLDYQQALEQDSHYGSAVVQADLNHLQGNRVPVKVTVNEAKRQKFELGLRYDSKDGFGARSGYDHYNLFNRGYVGSVLVDHDKYETTFGFGLSQPRQNNGHFWTSNINYRRSTTQNLEKKTLSGGVWYVRDKNASDARLGLEYMSESSRISYGGPDMGHSNALMLTATWKKQNIETQLRPANGYYVEGKIGSTLGRLASSTSMFRTAATAAYYYTPEQKKYGTWIVRGQFGYARARDDASMPSSLMFRTGGASSVRGYEQDSIGIAGPNDSVLPDRVLGVAGIEYQIPVRKDFAVAVFHDAGSVSHTFNDMKWQQGTGMGLRWFSPVAPFSFDLAYGHNDKKWRWHISLGTRF